VPVCAERLKEPVGEAPFVCRKRMVPDPEIAGALQPRRSERAVARCLLVNRSGQMTTRLALQIATNMISGGV